MAKCAECGYLGLYVDGHLTFRSANSGERTAGIARIRPTVSPVDGKLYVHEIACYRRAHDLATLCAARNLSSMDEVQQFIWEERHCPAFRRFVPHWSAEQHLTEEKAEELEQQRRVWEVRQAEQRQRWEEAQQLAQQQWAHSAEIDRRRYETSFKNKWLPLLVASLGVLISALIGWQGASEGARATREAAQAQIEAHQETGVTSAPPTE